MQRGVYASCVSRQNEGEKEGRKRRSDHKMREADGRVEAKQYECSSDLAVLIQVGIICYHDYDPHRSTPEGYPLR